MTKPQPIETAPKDNTEILLCFQGSWSNGYWAAFGGSGYDPKWIFANSGFPLGAEPTHWLPLPEIPNKETLKSFKEGESEDELESFSSAREMILEDTGVDVAHPKMKTFTLTYEELNLTREWFNVAIETYSEYARCMSDEDYFLAGEIHDMLGIEFKYERKADKRRGI